MVNKIIRINAIIFHTPIRHIILNILYPNLKNIKKELAGQPYFIILHVRQEKIMFYTML